MYGHIKVTIVSRSLYVSLVFVFLFFVSFVFRLLCLLHLRYDVTMVTSSSSFQFLVHDTDFSSPLPRYEFEGYLTDVWLPIKVPKVCLAKY